MAGVTDWILPIALLGGLYYEFVVRNGQDLQNLTSGLGGGSAGAAPCMGKDSAGNACPCTTSSVAYAYPVYSYKSSRKKSSKKGGGKKGKGGGGYGSSGGGTPADTTGGAPASSSTGNCDCSACSGGTTTTSTASNVWTQDPAFKNLPCPTLGQPCSTPGVKGGTSGPNKWCICGSGGATSTSKNIKSQSVTGGVATVENYVGSAIANMGLPAVLY